MISVNIFFFFLEDLYEYSSVTSYIVLVLVLLIGSSSLTQMDE